jgi:hypothetical protein
VSQLVVVVEILVAKRDPKNPLTDKGRDLVLDPLRMPLVVKANRSIIRIARSVAFSRAPASEVTNPASNAASTQRPSTVPKSNDSALHSVGIGALLASA